MTWRRCAVTWRCRTQSVPEAGVSSGFGPRLSRREFLRGLGQAGGLAALGLRSRDLRASLAPSAVVFTDITERAGLGHARNVSGDPANKHFLLEQMGCGVALFDYDHDGWLDIFLV